ncbi:DUF4145 domain-containing protein [Clostridium intestinale]|uniref:DUF4145 domain-containing protein n=1 Tax=Clostridium intestinale DSM 6191 TaxID=1121320 RepID=A0A1M6AJV3_9CLOT|nr:DUF4145 domain-containing protein [Clostridium intestinale]SHI36760.1 protein of unknown function [Clostridium intestinale DSM 6191]
MGGKTENLEKLLTCYHCGNKTKMENVGYHKKENFSQELGWEVTKWFMYFCPVCEKITIVEEYVWSEDVEINGVPIIHSEILYPNVKYDNKRVPNEIRQAFEAALKVKNIDGAICALSIRRTLDKICKDNGEGSGNLVDKISMLSKKGIIPPLLDKMTHVIRKLGNSAAHGDEIVFSNADINSIIDFTQIILEYIYILPYKVSVLERRVEPKQNTGD